MIHPAIYALLPALVLLAGSACRDGKTRTEYGGADTTVEADGRGVTDTGAGAADVVRRYYDAIRNGMYDTAYTLWDGSGKASGQTRAEFVKGFGQTQQTIAAIGDSVRVEGAAGSQYATVPVTIDAVLRTGARQRFVGTYTLRRSMVDGATPAQRRWRIYSAHLQHR